MERNLVFLKTTTTITTKHRATTAAGKYGEILQRSWRGDALNSAHDLCPNLLRILTLLVHGTESKYFS